MTQVLRQLPKVRDPNVLVGAATADDAGVYRISKSRAIVQTVDFFTAIVDDPFVYGQIAAASALSDIYAMGGRPLTALNLLAIPTDLADPKYNAFPYHVYGAQQDDSNIAIASRYDLLGAPCDSGRQRDLWL